LSRYKREQIDSISEMFYYENLNSSILVDLTVRDLTSILLMSIYMSDTVYSKRTYFSGILILAIFELTLGALIYVQH